MGCPADFPAKIAFNGVVPPFFGKCHIHYLVGGFNHLEKY
jgi:hypothetical protein